MCRYFLLLAILVDIGYGLNISVNSIEAIHEVEPYFGSYAIDMGILGENLRWNGFNFSSVKLHTLMKGLQPAILRFGGSPADWTVFTNDKSAQLYLNASQVTPSLNIFTRQDLDNIVNLIRRTGSRLLYDLDLQLRYGTQWDPTNAMQFMEYIQSKRYGKDIDFQLGNEPNYYGRPGQAKIKPERIGDDFVNLAHLIRTFPNLKNSMIVGPDSGSSSISPGSIGYECIKHVADKAGKYMKAVTFHHYYFRGDTAHVNNYLNPGYFSSLENKISIVKRAISNTSRPDIALWIGETADGMHGGTPNVSDRFVSGFLWLDNLGLSAKHGVSVVIRQTLYSGNYALLDLSLDPNHPPEVAGALGEAEAEADSGDGGDEADNVPSASSSLSEGKKRKRAKTQAQMDEALLKFLERPRQSEAVAEKDYWLSWMHKRLVGQKVLNVSITSNAAPTTRVYAHCATKLKDVPKGSITIFALNMNKNASDVIKISQYSDKKAAVYLMTPQGGNVLSKFVMVNGKVMEMKDESTLPDVTPVIQRANQITLPPVSFGFFVILGARAQACMG